MKHLQYSYILLSALLLSGCKFNNKNSTTEYQPETADTITYTEYYLDTTDAACKTKYKFCPSAKISYPIICTPDTLINNYLQKEIMQSLLLKPEASYYSSIGDMINSYFQESNTIKQEGDYDNESSAWAWEKDIKIIHKKGRYLTMGYHEYSYMGGAHPNYITYYKTYDFIQHKIIRAEDVFIDLKTPALLSIGEKYFRVQNELKPNEKFTESGFFIFGDGQDFENTKEYGKFRFNANFAFTKDGIEFLYNSYEIGPYAIGVNSVTIPYSELRPYLKITL